MARDYRDDYWTEAFETAADDVGIDLTKLTSEERYRAGKCIRHSAEFSRQAFGDDVADANRVAFFASNPDEKSKVAISQLQNNNSRLKEENNKLRAEIAVYKGILE